MGPLTVSRSASLSSSAPEEFPVEPHRVEGNEPDTSTSIPVHPTSVEINASASPEEPTLEPGEDVACALNTKPLPKVNAVAHEVQVRATGARPGNFAGERGEPAPPPSAEEVLALKKEVDALRNQLRLLQPQAPAEPAAPLTVGSETTSPLGAATPETQMYARSREAAPIVASLTEPMPFESTPHLSETAAPGHESLSAPALDFISSLPKRKRSFRARGNFTPGFRAGALRLAVLVVALLATMIGAAWYKHWLPGMHESKKIPVASWAGGVTTTTPEPEVQTLGPGISQAQTGDSELGKDTPASSNAVSKTPATSNETERQVTASNSPGGDSSLPRQAGGHAVTRGKPTLSASKTDRSSVHAPAMTLADSVPSSVEDSVVVPPKLIRSVRAAASLEDLRDFETGSVMIDAIIDTAGDVTSMNVLSGPPSLRGPALEALKNYKYEPATRNGKPVLAHVTVRIQFHFE